MDEREPGIYTITGGESIPLKYSRALGQHTYSGPSYSGRTYEPYGIYKYDDITSGIDASDTFVLVINPKQIVGVITAKRYNSFIKTLHPDNILIIPLAVNSEKQYREYNAWPEKDANGSVLTAEEKHRIDSEWKKISDNSFEIKTFGLRPGEYAFVFRLSEIAQFDYTAIFGFTIPENHSPEGFLIYPDSDHQD